MKLSIKGVNGEFKRLSVKLEESSTVSSKKVVEHLVRDLRDATPVDTGRARDSWRVTQESAKPSSFSVTNSTEYIQYLNQGSSKQAPAHFIESVALQYGKPVGTIVNVKQDTNGVT